MKRFLQLLLLGSLFALPACKRDGPSWDTGIVAPLAHASLSIDNLVADSLTTTNPDGSVKVVYTTQFLGLSTDTLFNIPDTTIPNTYNFPLGPPLHATVNEGFYLVSALPTQTTFAVSSAQLVFGTLKEGHMIVHLQNDIRKRVVLRYQIPSATKNSIAFDTSFVLAAAPDSLHSTFATAMISLAGYSIDFTGINHDRVNTLSTLFTAQIDPTDLGSCDIYQSDTVAANCTFSGIKPYYIRGYFGNQTVQVGPDEIGFSLFKKVRSGALGLDSLTMSLDIDNYVGMDSRLTVNRIWSHNTRTNQTVNLSNSIIGTPINVNRGFYSNSWPPVTPSSYSFTFDNSNSNAKNLVENLPDKLGYDVTLITNPLGNVSGNNDFLYADYGIDAKLNVEMPLSLFASQLVVADTIVPNFTSIKNREDILKGKLTLFAQNSFPFDAKLQIYLLDANGTVTDSLVALPNLIASGPLSQSNGYFLSQGFTNTQLAIPLNEQQTQNLFSTNRLIIVANFDTNSNPSYVKIFGSNRLDLQLSADFDYHIGN